jgi:hypothetical protein
MNTIIKEILFKLDIIAPLFVLLLVLTLRLKRKKVGSFSNYTLIVFILLQLILNALAGFLQYKGIYNLWVYHLNCQVTHIIFTFYFLRTIRRKRIVYAGFCTFVLADLVFLLSIQPYNSFPSYPYALSSFILVIYALIILNSVIDKIPTFHILSLKEFWLSAGILTYFGSAFLIFISYHYLSEVSLSNVSILWQVHNTFIGLSCIIFSKAITSNQWIQE